MTTTSKYAPPVGARHWDDVEAYREAENFREANRQYHTTADEWALIKAAYAGDATEVKTLLAGGARPLAVDYPRNANPYYAAITGFFRDPNIARLTKEQAAERIETVTILAQAVAALGFDGREITDGSGNSPSMEMPGGYLPKRVHDTRDAIVQVIRDTFKPVEGEKPRKNDFTGDIKLHFGGNNDGTGFSEYTGGRRNVRQGTVTPAGAVASRPTGPRTNDV